MRTIRIFIDHPLAVGTAVDLPEDAARHVARVLRLASGDSVTLFNGDGTDYRATLELKGKARAAAQILAARANTSESPLRLLLAQALARGDKMDFVVQKAVELGAAEIVPLITERSEVRLDAARADRRIERWRAVAASASEQSGRARILDIHPPQTLDAWLERLVDDGALRLALVPGATARVRELAPTAAGAMLVVGPEGGLGPRDLAALDAARFQAIGLGPRVLRTETAGLAALAALGALHGDL